MTETFIFDEIEYEVLRSGSDQVRVINITNKGLSEITIPSSVVPYRGSTQKFFVYEIGEAAFDGCKCLRKISISETIDTINCNFKDCTLLHEIIVSEANTSLKLIDGVLYNHSLIFCPHKKRMIKIPDSVTKIGDFAFKGCRNLESVTIPNSVTKIGDGAFEDCSSLESITIPDSVTEIGKGVFLGCTRLREIVVEKGNNHFRLIDGVLYNDSVSKLIRCPIKENSITIPNSVTEIGEGAFSGCSSIESLMLPESVTVIGQYAFHGCSCLESITIPDSVTEIGEGSFWRCSSLVNITIPNLVTVICDYAFWGCSSLESVTIPNSVTEIGEGAFGGCSSLESVTIPNLVTEIGEGAFQDCSSLECIMIPESVTGIGDWAFYGCTALSSVIIPKTVKIGTGVFEYCPKLNENSIVVKGGEKILINGCTVEAVKSPKRYRGNVLVYEGDNEEYYHYFHCRYITSRPGDIYNISVYEAQKIGLRLCRGCQNLAGLWC